jgi:hypothetical protein
MSKASVAMNQHNRHACAPADIIQAQSFNDSEPCVLKNMNPPSDSTLDMKAWRITPESARREYKAFQATTLARRVLIPLYSQPYLMVSLKWCESSGMQIWAGVIRTKDREFIFRLMTCEFIFRLSTRGYISRRFKDGARRKVGLEVS